MPPRKLPPVQELISRAQQGYTHQQIADWASSQIGHPVSRAAVTVALSRAGHENGKERYSAFIPWNVRVQHNGERPIRMLRAMARRHNGVALQPNEEKAVDALLEWLVEEDAVIAYCRDTTPGFYYVHADETGDRPGGLPIRPRELYPEEIVTEP